MLGEQTRCITGICANCEWNLVPFVMSSCHCGCEREGSDLKGTGRCSALLFATVVKNTK